MSTIFCLALVTTVIISFNGGISSGDSNHTGQLPVVRRVLNANYLPNDFSIELRQYHHRVFTYLIAGGAWLLGEDRALIVLHIIGMSLLTLALWRLCDVLGLPLSGFVAAGLLLATGLFRIGKGLEVNHFVGDPDIMPPTFAHALVLLAVASLLQQRYRLTVLFTGLATLFHLQIGLICAALITPFLLLKPRAFGLQEGLRLAVIFLLAAGPGLLDLWAMLRQGLVRAPAAAYSLAYYIDFRHPHHFELLSLGAALWVAGHLAALAAVYWRLRRTKQTAAARVGMLLGLGLTLAVLALLHFADYYLIKNDRLATIQFIRLSPLITVLGALGALTALNVWARGRKQLLVNGGLIAAAALWGVYVATRPEAVFHFGVTHAAEHQSSWTQICRWLKDNGLRAALYLTPPGQSGFTVLSDRSNVVEFKNNPDGALYLVEWFARLRDLAGGELPRGRGFENRKLLNQAYAALTTEQLLELGRKYGAAYAVLPQTSKAGLEIIFQNKGYRLVRLAAP